MPEPHDWLKCSSFPDAAPADTRTAVFSSVPVVMSGVPQSEQKYWTRPFPLSAVFTYDLGVPVVIEICSRDVRTTISTRKTVSWHGNGWKYFHDEIRDPKPTHPVRRRRLEKGDSRVAEQRLVESLGH